MILLFKIVTKDIMEIPLIIKILRALNNLGSCKKEEIFYY